MKSQAIIFVDHVTVLDHIINEDLSDCFFEQTPYITILMEVEGDLMVEGGFCFMEITFMPQVVKVH